MRLYAYVCTYVDFAAAFQLIDVALFLFPTIFPHRVCRFNLNGTNAPACPPARQYFNPLNTSEKRDVCLVPCSPAESCGLDNACAPGYTGTRCASCMPPGPGTNGYYVVGQSCMPCPVGAQVREHNTETLVYISIACCLYARMHIYA